MGELSQVINFRTTFNMKRRILENAEKKGMNQSEYILFAIESYLNSSTLTNVPNEDKDQSSELSALKEELAKANLHIQELQTHIAKEKKSVWQEATDFANKVAEERIKQAQIQAVRQFQETVKYKIEDSNTQLQLLQERLYAYETPLLKTVFQLVSKNPQVKDYPDVVYFLVHCYYNQVNYTRHAIGQ